MFDLAEKRLVWIPVRWPGLKPGKGEGPAEETTHEILCQVDLVDRDQLRGLFAFADTDDKTKGSVVEVPPADELAKFRALCTDWKGVKTGTKSAPMTDENILKMLEVPNFAAGFQTSYLTAWQGRLEEREKNSSSSSSGGRAEDQPAKAEAA
jgi:hypothetical protein